MITRIVKKNGEELLIGDYVVPKEGLDWESGLINIALTDEMKRATYEVVGIIVGQEVHHDPGNWIVEIPPYRRDV